MKLSSDDALVQLEKLFQMPAPRKAKCRILFMLAQKTMDGCIVELGAYTGCGAIALALGASVPVYAIDDYKRRQGWANEWYDEDNRILFQNNVEAAGVTVGLVQRDILAASRGWAEPIGLVHWDLGLRNRMVADFFAWEPHVISGGIIVVHDAMERQLGSRVLETIVDATGKFFPAEHMGAGMWRFQKR